MLMLRRLWVASFSAICLSSALSASESWPRSARSTASSRNWNCSGNATSQAIFISDWPARLSTEPESAAGAASSLLRASRRSSALWTSLSAVRTALMAYRRRAISARLALSVFFALNASASASAGSSSKSRSPALTVWPLSTWIAATLPGSSGFDHLGVANCLDLARGCRMDVQAAEIRPHQRRQREGANRRHQRDRQRRGRSFEDFERGREELTIATRHHDRRRA